MCVCVCVCVCVCARACVQAQVDDKKMRVCINMYLCVGVCLVVECSHSMQVCAC